VNVDLLIPVKPLHVAKSRLRNVASQAAGTVEEHTELVLALFSDTLEAALGANAVRRVVVVTTDARVAARATDVGAGVLVGEPPGGINAALVHGSQFLRRAGATVIGALQGDLPALRSDDLSAAIVSAAGRRSFHADRGGSGTTLLLSAIRGNLDPHFGPASAHAHACSGALPLSNRWPSLACDVDQDDDLRVAAGLRMGAHTSGLICKPSFAGRFGLVA